ncbi:hypothetical protein D3C86_537490 [compost metagenome]
MADLSVLDDLIIIPEAKIDFSQIAKDSYIDPSEEIKPQPVAISVGTSLYKGKSFAIPFGSYGDFSCIVGASKSRKTFFKSMIIAGYIGGQSNILNPSIQGHKTKDKFVIEFDTEQSKFHAQRVVRRVCDMVGGNYDQYKTFALRGYAPKERFEFIDWIINESEYRNNIGLMSIDGYVDLVTDFNSLEQASGLTDKLLEWTSKGNMHITGILHKNFGTSKPVGHVGSSVLKKAETVVFIENDKDTGYTKVNCEYSRNIPFEDLCFGVNEDWLPHEIDNSLFGSMPNNKTPNF